MRKRLLIGFILVLMLALHVFISIGQGGSFTLFNDGNISVDGDAVLDAAQPFINEYGAHVAIFTVVSGDQSDFTSRLVANGLATNSDTNPNTFAIYIATEEQYSEIRWGSDFNKIDGDSLRSNNLNPLLRERNFTQAFVNTLNAAHGQMSNSSGFYGFEELFNRLLTPNPLSFMLVLMVIVMILQKLGIIKGGGSSSDNHWTGSDSGGDSGGGSSGGSWSD